MGAYSFYRDRRIGQRDKEVKPTGPLKIDYSNPISRDLVGVVHESILGGIRLTGNPPYKTTKHGKGWSSETTLGNSGWELPELNPVTHLSEYTIVVIVGQTNFTGTSRSSVYYAEKASGDSQKTLIVYTENGKVSYQTRDADALFTQDEPVVVTPDPNKTLHTISFVRAAADDRTIRVDGDSANYTGSASGTYNAVEPFICSEPNYNITNASNASVLTVYTFKRVLSEKELESLERDPFQLLIPANAPQFFPVLVGGGGVTVSASTSALSLSNYSANISVGTTISANTKSLALTTYPTSVTVGATVQTNTQALSLATYTANISAAVNVNTTTASLSVTENQAGISAATNVAGVAESLVITENQAEISAAINVGTTSDALSVTTFTANVSTGAEVQANSVALSVTPQAASISAATDLQTNTTSLTLGVNNATVDVGDGAVNVQPSTIALTITENQASISAATNVSTTLESLVLTKYSPGVELSIDVQTTAPTLVVSTNTATVSAPSPTVNVSAVSVALTITTNQASVSVPVSDEGFSLLFGATF